MAQLDHLILAVNDLAASIAFYTRVLGFTNDGERPPFSVVRITMDLVIQLAPWGTNGGTHLAFTMTDDEFDRTVVRLREAGIAYGDSFDAPGNGKGPSDQPGARGMAPALYVLDPSNHLIEFRRHG